MVDPKFLDELAKRFAEAVPPGFRQLQSDLEKNFHAVLQGAFARMELVTREEFDVQQAVLARTRARLEALEKQVAALEAQLLTPPAATARTGRKAAKKPDDTPE
ncbi:MAG: accessory factor UbiK family protein [Pseudomonadota bacterium]|nr:accessory factor UbiK family protein [Pseudomonadota bacterium]